MRKLRIRKGRSFAQINSILSLCPCTQLSLYSIFTFTISFVSKPVCKRCRGQLRVHPTEENTEGRMAYHTGHGPWPFRRLHSLFTEATKLVQDSADGAVVAFLDVCLQHGGQSVLLHPHLNPRTEGRGELKLILPIPASLEHASCFFF